MKKLIILFIMSVIISTYCSTQKENMKTVRVKTENGEIEGLQDKLTGLQMYFGIPFAKPPVGELRWKAPQPADPWDGVLETKKFGPGPVQANVYGDMRFRSDTMSEDCLYLNIWAPPVKSKELLPVLVYFYGGGFVAGDGSEPKDHTPRKPI